MSFFCSMTQKQSIWCTLLIPSIWTMNHRIWHFKRTNFDPLALVQKSCCGLLPSVLLFEGVVFFMSPYVSVLLLAWKILLCLEFGWHVDHFSLCSIVLRQKCVIMMSLFGKFKRIVCTEHAHHCVHPYFFLEKIHCQHLSSSSRKDFFCGIINVWSQNKVMLFFVALIFWEARGEKLL